MKYEAISDSGEKLWKTISAVDEAGRTKLDCLSLKLNEVSERTEYLCETLHKSDFDEKLSKIVSMIADITSYLGSMQYNIADIEEQDKKRELHREEIVEIKKINELLTQLQNKQNKPKKNWFWRLLDWMIA